MEEAKVVLVNNNDEAVGTMGKMEAHEKGMLHRAFSVFIFNTKGEMLLQQRALNKYHSGGLWTNACCSHPFVDEKIEDAAHRRLIEEMGFDTKLTKAFDFIYKAAFENGLTEYEFDHVFAGEYNGKIKPEKEEVNDYRFSSFRDVEQSLQLFPEIYTAWFHIAFPKVKAWKQLEALG